MIEYRYKLEPYKGMNTRYFCPNCEHRDKTFSLYIDTETGQYFNQSVGRCNRESKCGHHYTPKQYFQVNGISFDAPKLKVNKTKPKRKPVSFIPFELFQASLKDYEKNHFIQYLIKLFGIEITTKIVNSYFIATSKYWNGATVFWQIDLNGEIRTGKIMLYSPTTGKRVKEPFNHISWIHKALKEPEYELKQCFFGEHLINQFLLKPVAIVESEKTAIIASVYLTQFIWIAVGSLSNLNPEKCSVLKGRKVVLFPDLNGYNKWSKIAKEISHMVNCTISNLLETNATDFERHNGLDLADYLIRFDYNDFINPKPQILHKLAELEKPTKAIRCSFYNDQPKFVIQKCDIDELRNYFVGLILQAKTIKLDSCTTITDVPKFIESHFKQINANIHNKSCLIFYDRLLKLKALTQNL